MMTDESKNIYDTCRKTSYVNILYPIIVSITSLSTYRLKIFVFDRNEVFGIIKKLKIKKLIKRLPFWFTHIFLTRIKILKKCLIKSSWNLFIKNNLVRHWRIFMSKMWTNSSGPKSLSILKREKNLRNLTTNFLCYPS